VKLKLTLEYDGSRFRGWARQPGKRTVEGVVREALDVVFPAWEGLAVAGRTDAGVHATGQVASVDVDGGPPRERAAEALSAALPEDVAVLRAEEVGAEFHARFSARSRSYRYRILTRPTRAPLEVGRVLWWPRPLDLDALSASAALLPGDHDFRAFTPTGTQYEVYRRTVKAARWTVAGDCFEFTITAESFLRHMVRALVGTMLESGSDAPDRMAALLAGKPRSDAGLTAPPSGLYLEKVEYEASGSC
jgi:tRNA pseudouridine38-40 synthase